MILMFVKVRAVIDQYIEYQHKTQYEIFNWYYNMTNYAYQNYVL